MTEPTDVDMDAVLCKHWPAFSMQATLVRMWVRAAMRDAIAKWATPTAEQQAAPKAAHKAALTRDQIREVFMAHGFTVKEGHTDLKQYVYDAAYALLAMGSAPKAAPGESVNGWPVEAKIYKRCDEWVLELSGAINDCAFTCRHTQPGYLQPEDVAGLPSLYSEGIAPQQEAQEPSHRETVDVVGVRSNGEHVNLEKIAMPPRMKAREIAIEQFGSFKDDDGSDADMCFGALEYFLEWLIQQGWSKAPQPAPAPLSDDVVKDAARYRWLIDQHWIQTEVDWRLISTHQDSTIRQLDAAIDAALAAQGGKCPVRSEP